MTIFDVLALIGGLCLFLFGMNVMVSVVGMYVTHYLISDF